MTVLGELQKITEEFVKQVYTSKNQSESIVKAAGGKVFTYGSYRLGVFGPGESPSSLLYQVILQGKQTDDGERL